MSLIDDGSSIATVALPADNRGSNDIPQDFIDNYPGHVSKFRNLSDRLPSATGVQIAETLVQEGMHAGNAYKVLAKRLRGSVSGTLISSASEPSTSLNCDGILPSVTSGSQKGSPAHSCAKNAWNETEPVKWNDGELVKDAPEEKAAPIEEFAAYKSKMTTAMSGMFDFANAEAIKERVRNAKLKPQDTYNVHDFYHTEGLFQAIAKNHYFENVTLTVIVINAIWIWIDTDWNSDSKTMLDAHVVFQVADCLFFGYFVVELFIRFMAFERKISCCKDAWFVFDSTLVALYAFDPFIIALITQLSGSDGLDLPTSILRLFRLARLSRLVRMLRSLPELMIMIKGMMSAAASVGYTLALLLIITYVFAIAFTQLATNTNDEFREKYFSSVPLSMYSLIIYGTFLDALSDFGDDIREESTVLLILASVFVCLASLTVMNMLIGVLCEVISAVAEEEKESMIIDKIHEKFGKIVEKLDKNKSGTISWEEFQQIVQYPEALRALESVNVDAVGMIDMAEDFFFDDGKPVQLTFENFMEMILDMRGGQTATLKDVMSFGTRFNRKFLEVKDQMACMDSKLDELVALTQRRGMQVKDA